LECPANYGRHCDETVIRTPTIFGGVLASPVGVKNTDLLSKSRYAANVKQANSLYWLLATFAFAAKLPHLPFLFF
jgi:hypothetical protein